MYSYLQDDAIGRETRTVKPEPKKILWVDDEIELLRSHFLFLRERGYEVVAASSGEDAVELARKGRFDAVLLDEMMPGKDGLETLAELKAVDSDLPVVMVTKSEAEDLMTEAIGKRIADFLVKPVNPHQILSTLKRLLEARKIIGDRLGRDYVQEFQAIRRMRSEGPDWRSWATIWQTFATWDLELEKYPDTGLRSTQEGEKKEANIEFARYVESSYGRWLQGAEHPILSSELFKTYAAPLLKSGEKVYFVVMDCMRLDQWLALEPFLRDYYETELDLYYSILPTATPYARNAIFAGLYPAEIAKQFPQYWDEKGDDTSRNRHERQLLDKQIERLGLKLSSEAKYVKIFNLEEAQEVRRHVGTFYSSQLVSIVVNFVDILMHARGQSKVLQEIAQDEIGFRSLTRAWFENSPLLDTLRSLSKQKCTVILTTDHGSVQSNRPAIAKGDRETSPNIRYKFGTNVNADDRQAFIIRNPSAYRLPDDVFNKRYIIAREDFYFVYPTHFEEYKKEFMGSFQHGGISMEEMIIPVVTMKVK